MCSGRGLQIKTKLKRGKAQRDGRASLFYRRRTFVAASENLVTVATNRGRLGSSLNDTITLPKPTGFAWYKNLGRISYRGRVIANFTR